jgi:hypothetical protein
MDLTQVTLTMDGERDDWTCTCGNQSHTDGFYPCDPTGREVEPTLDEWGGHNELDACLLVCARCESIIRMV